MSKYSIYLKETISGLYWLLWLTFDVFVIYQVYYYYPSVWLGVTLLVMASATSYLEFLLYRRILLRLFL
ncbi:MAG: hypothetical protein M0Z77_02355 [Thermoplasmatales archaeon]|jgi:hypothetical protein|nr:hypothetical protein [Candidatus Thermoplasmatota archaeon]MDA8054479.1 hypothetical protein [Thermoplasmatales archaeon]